MDGCTTGDFSKRDVLADITAPLRNETTLLFLCPARYRLQGGRVCFLGGSYVTGVCKVWAHVITSESVRCC